jgi:YjbE family integral membrane protein
MSGAISTFAEVVVINVVLSGDNAIVVGMAAAGLPRGQRLRALWLGITIATVLRVVFAVAATTLLHIIGLLLAGGILLLWVSWKLWREITVAGREQEREAEALLEDKEVRPMGATKTFRRALWQIIVADVSMSLDNVLAVAGAAMDHPMILAAGLLISILLMGCAAALIAKLLERHRWLAFAGLLIIVYVALKMIWAGAHDVMGAMASAEAAARFWT